MIRVRKSKYNYEIPTILTFEWESWRAENSKSEKKPIHNTIKILVIVLNYPVLEFSDSNIRKGWNDFKLIFPIWSWVKYFTIVEIFSEHLTFRKIFWNDPILSVSNFKNHILSFNLVETHMAMHYPISRMISIKSSQYISSWYGSNCIFGWGIF